MLIIFVTVLYWVTHLWNFAGAPWNQNGLFDDAAWDIYFAKIHAFHAPFQAAYYDAIGNISREIVFHDYITIFFRAFGYNLLIFNISLLVLGFVTVLFTTLLIHTMFKRWWVTVVSAIVLNFFPLHFLHIFMGHRYAIVAPLMMVSYYFLYTGVTTKSFVRSAVSGVFAALCVGSAIMGRQYLYGLILTALCLVCVPVVRKKIGKVIPVIAVWAGSCFIAGSPLILYILFNRATYFSREQGLVQDFFRQHVTQYFSYFIEVFFASHTFRRQFLPDFPVIPFAYYVFLIPGLIVAIRRRRFEIFWLSVVPIIGAFVSGSYDFRVLMAVPFWVIAMGMSLDEIARIHLNSRIQHILICIASVALVAGLIPSMHYIWSISHDPNSVYLLPHADVAVSRLVQDIAAGVKNPTSAMKWDEFNRRDTANSPYDVFVTPKSAYAIMHVYVQDFDDKKILSFADGGIELLQTPEQLFGDNIRAISGYTPHGKDLLLIWERSDKVANIIQFFSQYKQYGDEKSISDSVDGIPFSLYLLTIKRENIVQFQREVAAYETQ